jgi:flagellar biosynthetic protein FlhB
MDGDDSMSEKTEKASAYKLKKAREQGRVSKSVELTTCVFLLVFLGVFAALWPTCLIQIKALSTHLLYLAGRLSFSVDTMNQLQQWIFITMLSLWMPFALVGLLAIAAATIAQTGFVWSSTPLTPDFKRLDLAQGFKRLWSSKSWVDAGKTTLKLTLVCCLLSLSLRHELASFLRFMAFTPAQYPRLFIALLSKIILQVLALLLALSMIDKYYTTWTFGKDQRMSKQELKDEYRQREGDPKIKAKIKQLQYQLRQKTASLEQVKTADVLITNPTHLAIALKYDRTCMPAPKVVCKAQGDMVKHMKALAARHHVAIIENKALARLLFVKSDLNQWIAREHFPMVAMVFRDVYRQRTAA